MVRITWLGHATVLVEGAGSRVLTDPTVTARLAHLRRRTPVPVVDPVDAVLISHLHMDHLHVPSLRITAAGAAVMAPAGARSLIDGLGAGEIHEVRRGERHKVAGIAVDVVQADHSNRRGPHSKLVAEPVGYLLHVDDLTIYFAGDTDLFEGMDALGPIDVALVPIWGWGPTLGERHLDPRSAATATQRLDAAQVIPIHWGTYSPVRARRGSPPWLERPLGAFREALADLGLADRLVALAPGATSTFDSAVRQPRR